MSGIISCAILGHSPMRFAWGFDEEDSGCKKLKLTLLQQIMELRQQGVTQFSVACDCGVGLYAAEAVNLLLHSLIFMLGAGIGSCWAFIAQRVMAGARKGEEDVAASSVATVQQTGFALGAAVAGLVANAAGLSAGLNRTDVGQAALWVPTCFVLAALVAAALGIRLARRQMPSM